MLFWWVVLAVFWFVVDDDGFLDYVQVLHQFSFVALNQQTASRINLEINAFAMPLSVLNDLAEAMKALDGKKIDGRNFVGQLRQYAVASLLAFVTVRGVHRHFVQ